MNLIKNLKFVTNFISMRKIGFKFIKRTYFNCVYFRLPPIERMLGASTETEKIAQGGEKDDRFLISSKALLTRDQIRMLPKTKALFFSENLKPMNFEMLPYWEDRDLKKIVNN